MAMFAKNSWRRGDRDSALKLAKWSRYVAIAAIVLGIIALVAIFGNAGRYNNDHRISSV
jgi:hypothetical protein